ncbi:diguanylate cyclase [soil metagenome]
MKAETILIVDDDTNMIQAMAGILTGVAELRFATNGSDALSLARASVPDLMLLDAEMPGLSGFDVCAQFKADPRLADVPIIFVTSHSETSFEIAGFELGAADFIAKPVSPPLLLARVRTQLRVKQLTDQLRRLSTIDPLTGVANRRRFDEALQREWQRARRSGDPIALLMIDVDHFKSFNDRYDHPAGDTCLQAVAQALVQANLRPADLVARYGGEEFVMLLPQTTRGGAERVARRVLSAIENQPIEHAASPTAGHVTVSIGVACYDDASTAWVQNSADSRFAEDEPMTAAALLRAADVALYAAKHAGRAQAQLLDVADVEAPLLARAISLPADK